MTGVKSWQIFYREIDRDGVVTFQGKRPLSVIFDKQTAKRKLNKLKKQAAVNQSYMMVEVSAEGAIGTTE